MIVDDHALVREGLEALLNSISNFKVLCKASNGYEAIELHHRLNPEITLMDIKMPGLDGISAQSKILAHNPAAKIIILTTYIGGEDVYKAFETGARAYLLKDTPLEELRTIIMKVVRGEKHIPPDIAQMLALRVGSQQLTEREIEVLEAMAQGLTNREISQALFISTSTVKTHINSLFNKLQAKNRTEAIAKAIQKGILHP